MATNSPDEPVVPVETPAASEEGSQDPSSARYQPARDNRGRVVRLREGVDVVARSWERAWERITAWTDGGEAKPDASSPKTPKSGSPL